MKDPSLWYSVANMLSPEQIEELGLRKEQDPNVWIVRMADALSEAHKKIAAMRKLGHEAAAIERVVVEREELRARNATLRRELDYALVELVRYKRLVGR